MQLYQFNLLADSRIGRDSRGWTASVPLVGCGRADSTPWASIKCKSRRSRVRIRCQRRRDQHDAFWPEAEIETLSRRLGCFVVAAARRCSTAARQFAVAGLLCRRRRQPLLGSALLRSAAAGLHRHFRRPPLLGGGKALPVCCRGSTALSPLPLGGAWLRSAAAGLHRQRRRPPLLGGSEQQPGEELGGAGWAASSPPSSCSAAARHCVAAAGRFVTLAGEGAGRSADSDAGLRSAGSMNVGTRVCVWSPCLANRVFVILSMNF